MLRILIAHNHPIIRQGLKQLLENTPDIVVVGEAGSDHEAIKELDENACDIVLLGIASSGINSIELLKQIKVIKPDLPVLMLSVSAEEHYCERFLRAGASGFLTEQSAANELVDAVKKVSSGRKYITPSLMEKLAEFSTGGDKPLLDTLSDREYEVMVSIASGKKLKQVAGEMFLSIKTISTYHSRILQKLRLSNDAQLIRYAIEYGIVHDGVIARENQILTDLKIKTASAVAAIREIWHLRKDVILILIVASIISYVLLTYLLSILL